MVKIHGKPLDLNIIQAYMTAYKTIERVYADIQRLVKQTEPREITCVMGEFNAQIGAGAEGKEVGLLGLA